MRIMVKQMLTKRENYLSYGVHVGTTMKTKDMSKYIYKIRPNGLGVLNVAELDKRIRMVAKYLKKREVVFVGRSKNAKKALEAFSKATGIRAITGRFMPGTFTNPSSRNFVEPEVVFLIDPSVDTQAMDESIKMNIPIIALCDTFNTTAYVDLVLPANNKSRKSIGFILYLLAKEILKEQGKIKTSREFPVPVKEFTGEKNEK